MSRSRNDLLEFYTSSTDCIYIVPDESQWFSDNLHMPYSVDIRHALGTVKIGKNGQQEFTPYSGTVYVMTATINPFQMTADELNFYTKVLLDFRQMEDINFFPKGRFHHALRGSQPGQLLLARFAFVYPLSCYQKKDGSYAFEIVGHVLGEGNYSRVHKGLGTISPLGDGSYEIKPPGHVYRSSIHEADKPHKNGLHEYNLVSRTQHLHSKQPNIRRLANGSWVSDRVECCMPGQDMACLLIDERGWAQKLLTTDQRLELTVALLRTLQVQLFDNGLYSRDIKLDNTMVCIERLEVNNIDYNLAQLIQGGNVPAKCGTAEYMAPEVLTAGLSSPLSDLFSMGRVIGLLWGMHQPDARNRQVLLAHARNDVMSGLFNGIKCDLSLEHKIRFKLLLQHMLKFEPEGRCSLQDALAGFDRIRLERRLQKLPLNIHVEVERANSQALAIRAQLYEMQRAHDGQEVKHSELLTMADIVSRACLSLASHPDVLAEYVHSLGIKALHGLTTKLQILGKLSDIVDDFKSQQDKLSFAEKFVQGGTPRLFAVHGKTMKKYTKARLGIDEAVELMAKIDKKLRNYIYPELGKVLTRGRPESAYNFARSSAEENNTESKKTSTSTRNTLR